jgi:hypothetical protein
MRSEDKDLFVRTRSEDKDLLVRTRRAVALVR